MHLENGLLASGVEGWPSGEALEQHAPERVQIAPMVDVGGPLDLLGAHVAGGPYHEPRLGQTVHPGRLDGPGDAEIDQYGTGFRQHDVLRLHVAVNNPL